jgi:hypothetical protein
LSVGRPVPNDPRPPLAVRTPPYGEYRVRVSACVEASIATSVEACPSAANHDNDVDPPDVDVLNATDDPPNVYDRRPVAVPPADGNTTSEAPNDNVVSLGVCRINRDPSASYANRVVADPVTDDANRCNASHVNVCADPLDGVLVVKYPDASKFIAADPAPDPVVVDVVAACAGLPAAA